MLTNADQPIAGATCTLEIPGAAPLVEISDTDGRFDVNADGAVNNADFGAFIEECQGTWIGDSNLDGEFNSSDFVAVFTGGEYETGNDAGWALGDWNGDNKFDSSDFVCAFSCSYEVGARDGGLMVVPEPRFPTLVRVMLFCIVVPRAKRIVFGGVNNSISLC